MQSVASDGYWESHWEKVVFGIADEGHPLRAWIEGVLGHGTDKSCIEIGCYPGKFLAVLGEMGYELNGVDSYRGTASTLPAWLESSKYRVGRFYEEDFASFSSGSKFDLVCSFGLVEHFEDYDKVIAKHVSMTKRGGRVLIEVPNLDSPLYRFLYKLLEPDVLKNHVPEAMRMINIVDSLQRHGCIVRRAEYIGHFYFRFVTKDSMLSKLAQLMINLLRPISYILPKSIYARYIGVVAEPA